MSTLVNFALISQISIQFQWLRSTNKTD